MMRRAFMVWLLAACALVVAACGSKTVEREGPVTVANQATGASTQPTAAVADGSGGRPVRIWVVTHGQAASPFWAIIRNGVEAAARETDVLVTYRAPDVYDLKKMVSLVDQAIAQKPDGLVVSLPEPGLAPAIRRAVKAGIPTVTINSGSDLSKKLGVLTHVGQPEDRAGLGAGRRLARLGVRRALCLNLKIPNVGLDARCAGLAKAMRAVGGRSTMVRIDDQDPNVGSAIAAAVARDHSDGVLALNGTGGLAAVKALAGRPNVTLATFDLGPDVLQDVQDGKLAFAVDQQAYLQGYLPVVLLAQRARYGIFPAQGDVIATGPNFVTKDNAAQAIALAKRSIR